MPEILSLIALPPFAGFVSVSQLTGWLEISSHSTENRCGPRILQTPRMRCRSQVSTGAYVAKWRSFPPALPGYRTCSDTRVGICRNCRQFARDFMIRTQPVSPERRIEILSHKSSGTRRISPPPMERLDPICRHSCCGCDWFINESKAGIPGGKTPKFSAIAAVSRARAREHERCWTLSTQIVNDEMGFFHIA
jgi:hypothetical protein